MSSLFGKFLQQPPKFLTNADIDLEMSRNNGFLDYLSGRPIKTFFRDLTKVDPTRYNQFAGKDMFEKTVIQLIKKSHR
jgi:hypothetical protein